MLGGCFQNTPTHRVGEGRLVGPEVGEGAGALGHGKDADRNTGFKDA